MKTQDAAALLGIPVRDLMTIAATHPALIQITRDADVFIAPNCVEQLWHAARAVRPMPMTMTRRL